MMGLKLLTSNAQKYAPMMEVLSHLGIELHIEDLELVEIQTRDISQSANAKALDAAKLMSVPVLIDDVALYLDAYNDYPGPLIKHTLKGIGYDGIKALLRDKNNAATIVCALSIAIGSDLFCYQGRVKGYIDLDVEIEDERMMLSSIFKCEDGEPLGMKHRELAFESLSRQLLEIRAKCATYAVESGHTPDVCDLKSAYHCVFCQEFDDVESSVFADLVGDEIQNRIVYEDDDFILIVPIGLFVEGGLLLLSKEHIPSFAHLPQDKYAALNELLDKIKLALAKIWGVVPIVFEHGPAIDKTKGKCCVDHAHFNIFPVSVNVHFKLEDRFPQSIKDTSFLSHYKNLEDGYLYVDSPISGMYVYDGNNVPSQLLRRYITEMLGIPDRWHWRHYMGIDEMKTTLDKLRYFK
ncbi:non-canonical purine NTP pyrophosphatase [uncultured Tolumonas sp.]|uniref:non-canonical purine NTP pyrophosphatase n=1 Tax=uncultured Tolumonas sp. TaxID=263765 RepID=UPI002A0A333B|nr:non-canonical purine NTP pyrophosphatase [uncultured Tolumonas sp.]